MLWELQVISEGTQPCTYMYSLSPKHPQSKLAQNFELSSMCCMVGPCWLSILNIAVHDLEG